MDSNSQPDEADAKLSALLSRTEFTEFDRSEQTFFKLLPELIQKYRGQWVAVAGENVITVAKTKLLTHEFMAKQGAPRGTFTIRRVEDLDLLIPPVETEMG